MTFKRVIILFFIFIHPFSLYANRSLELIWESIEKAESRLQLKSHETKQWSIAPSYLSKKMPSILFKESLAYRLHLFCHRYTLQVLKELPSFYKPQIELLIWEHYYPQVTNLLRKDPVFTCYPTPIPYKKFTLVDFRMDPELGFYPIRWKYMENSLVIEEHFALYNKEGKADKKIKYLTKPTNCPYYGEEDTKNIGKPDIFYYYNNCSLSYWEEDYNLDGIRERKCIIQSQNPLTFECTGIAENYLKLARDWKESNPELSIQYYLHAKNELENYFGKNIRHLCPVYLDLLKIYFDLENFKKSSEVFSNLELNPYCKKEYLEAYIYEGFIQLYKLKNYSKSIEKYEKARKIYIQNTFQESEEINLSLAVAYLKNESPEQCLASLNRILIPSPQNQYFYFYYKGSCFLEKNQLSESYENLTKSLNYAFTKQEKAQSYLKLGILFSIEENYNEAEVYFQKAIQLNPQHKKFIEEYKKYKTFLAK